MMEVVSRYNPLWAGTGTGTARPLDGHAVVEPVSGQIGKKGHGPAATTTLDQGHGRVSDSTLRPQDASGRGRRPPQNAGIAPVAFPGGRNPYLDRPLPPRPSRNIAVLANTAPSGMPARPSTSSGPSSSKSSGLKPSLDNRLSKDDIALTRAGLIKGKSQAPVAKARWPLTPEPSPTRTRMPSVSPTMSPASRLPTPQSSASGEIPIGMALGSPTQDSTAFPGSPQAGWWQPQTQTSVQTSHSPPPAQASEPTVQRSKTQKRRLFTSLFGGRKHAEPSKVAEPVEADRNASSSTTAVSKVAATPARSNTVASRKTPKHKPIIIRSMTEPTTDTAATPANVPTISEPIPSTSTSGAGFLNVDIPDIRLERYSVMFSGVLNPGGTKSLLERRQATLEKLKTISDRIEQSEGDDKTRPRRATSPQPMKSPAFSLFPQTPNRHSGIIVPTESATASTTSLAPPRGLTRSNTSPAYLPSPSRTRFEPSPQLLPEQPKKEKKTVTIVSPRTMDERNRAAQVERLREQQVQRDQQTRFQSHTAAPPAATTLHFHPNESSLVLDSPQSATSSSSTSSTEYEVDSPLPVSRRAALRPDLSEPEWEIITPPSSTSPSSSSTVAAAAAKPPNNATPSTRNKTGRSPSVSSSSVASQRSVDTVATSASAAARVSVDEQDAALKAAVEISIARQISISRQQRRLLRPFGQAGAGGRGRSSSAAAAAGGGGNKRGVMGKNSEEHLTVGVIKGRVTPVMVGPGSAGDRRSERVVLDVVQ
ncbi:hypothetical protein VTI28DRAFT_8152 [Corynascus sepedonium]